MDSDDGLEEDEPVFPWLPPDDRLWRHPSELADAPPVGALALARHEADRRLWAVALLAGVVGALMASGVGVATGGFRQSSTVVRPIERVVDPAQPQVSLASNPKESNVVTIAEGLRPAIVELLVQGSPGNSSGSGVVFRSDGYVLTNNHVVAGATSITAVMSDGRQVKCRLVGADPETDIAVVKISAGAARSVATLGTADRLKVGVLAVAIGSPLGLEGGPSVTTGVISALGRQVTTSDGPPLLDMIQTDAPIAPGSSGGALVDSGGDVVGITTAVAVNNDGPQGLGFATPIDIAKDVADQLLTTGHVTHVWLGVEGADVDAATAGRLGITGGAVVQKVDADSPAARAGIVATDVITSVDGQPVETMGSLELALRGRRPGIRISIDFMHDGHAKQVKTRLVERPEDPSS